MSRVHLVIPDTQVKEGVDQRYLSCVGEYIADYRPDVVVHIGDHWDMPSLSSYDRGTRRIEGKRYTSDIAAGNEGMRRIMAPIKRKRSYNPELHFCMGNHEQRIERHADANPELHGKVGYHDLALEGWEVHDFLKPVVIDGVSYVHYVANPLTGKPLGGQASNVLKNAGTSFVMGHRQVLEVATRQLGLTGQQQWGIIAGACYPHDEEYKGYQGNKHWRGVIVLHEVEDGDFDPMFVSLNYLMKRYS